MRIPIFGADLTSVHGKTTWCTPVPVVADHVVVPQGVKDQNKTVMLVADMFFLDGIAFLVTVLRNIKFVTFEYLPMWMTGDLAKHIGEMVDVYQIGGFNIRTILMDREFEKINPFYPT